MLLAVRTVIRGVMSQTRCAWCSSAIPEEEDAPALLRVCQTCASNGRLTLQPDPPAKPRLPLEDPDAIPGTPAWIRWTAIGLLVFVVLSWFGLSRI